jgi:hypothetical protein
MTPRNYSKVIIVNPPEGQDDFEDEGEFYRAWNEHKKARKKDKLHAAQQALEQLGAIANVRVLTEYHWQIDLPTGVVDYWPSTGKWRYLKQTNHGTPAMLMGFLRKRI